MLKERILDLNLDIKKKEVPTIVEKEIIDLAGEKEDKYRSEIETLNRQIRSQKVDFTNKLKVMERERDEICDQFREREIKGTETAKQLEESEETTVQLTESNDNLVKFNHGLNAQNDQLIKLNHGLNAQNDHLLKLNHSLNAKSLPLFELFSHFTSTSIIFVHPDQLYFGHDSIGKYFGNKAKGTVENRSIDDTTDDLENGLNHLVLFQSRPMRVVIRDFGSGARLFATNGNRRLKCIKDFIERWKKRGHQNLLILIPVTLEVYKERIHESKLSTKNHGQSVKIYDNKQR
jgi:hypothetical protein